MSTEPPTAAAKVLATETRSWCVRVPRPDSGWAPAVETRLRMWLVSLAQPTAGPSARRATPS